MKTELLVDTSVIKRIGYRFFYKADSTDYTADIDKTIELSNEKESCHAYISQDDMMNIIITLSDNSDDNDTYVSVSDVVGQKTAFIDFYSEILNMQNLCRNRNINYGTFKSYRYKKFLTASPRYIDRIFDDIIAELNALSITYANALAESELIKNLDK